MTTCLGIGNATHWADARSIERISCYYYYYYYYYYCYNLFKFAPSWVIVRYRATLVSRPVYVYIDLLAFLRDTGVALPV